MVEGKPYRYGLIAAGLCVAAVGLFIMTQERPHIYATICALGISMVCVGTVWSLCQCYPKVDTHSREKNALLHLRQRFCNEVCVFVRSFWLLRFSKQVLRR